MKRELARLLRCKRCCTVVSDYELEAVTLSCGCEYRFCQRCLARTEQVGDCLSTADWCESLAEMHRREGGRYVDGHHGPFIQLSFHGGRRQEFFLYQVEIRQLCGTDRLKTFVRPWLAHEMMMLVACPYSSGSQMAEEYQRRQFRQRARAWLQRGAA